MVSAGWWVAAVQLTPAADRPYIGGSQNNSLFNLIFGYNGFGRITGNETGSVGGGGAAGPRMWGPTGLDPDVQRRLRRPRSRGSSRPPWCCWPLCCGMTRRAPRHDRTRAAFLLWGGWLVVTMAVFSFAQGIIHPYYTVALAPAIGALVGMGAVTLWRHRDAVGSPASPLAVALALTGGWAFVMLDRTPSWNPWLRFVVLAAGIVAALGLLAAPSSAGAVRRGVAMLAIGAALGRPLAFTDRHRGHPGLRRYPDRRAPRRASPGPGGASPAAAGRFGVGRGGAGGFTPPGFAGAVPAGSRRARTGLPAGSRHRRRRAPGPAVVRRRVPGAAGGGGRFRRVRRGRAGGGAAGGLLNASHPERQAGQGPRRPTPASYTWVAATVGANSAAGYQLGSDDPVMAIGGFNGTDPDPSLAAFEKLVAEHKVHYFIAGGGFAGGFAGRFGFGALGGGTARSARAGAPGARRGRWASGVPGLLRHHQLGRVPLQGDHRRRGHPLRPRAPAKSLSAGCGRGLSPTAWPAGAAPLRGRRRTCSSPAHQVMGGDLVVKKTRVGIPTTPQRSGSSAQKRCRVVLAEVADVGDREVAALRQRHLEPDLGEPVAEQVPAHPEVVADGRDPLVGEGQAGRHRVHEGVPLAKVRNCLAVWTALVSSGVAHTQPIFHPVTEKVLPADEIVTVRSACRRGSPAGRARRRRPGARRPRRSPR